MEDLDDLDDSNYMPESKEDISLGPDEFDIPEDFLDLETFRRRLISSARSIKGGGISLKPIKTCSVINGWRSSQLSKTSSKGS